MVTNKIKEVVQRKRRFAAFPLVCADHAARIDNADLKETLTNAEKLAAVLEHAYQRYDYDMVLVFTDPYVEAHALGCKVEFTPQPVLKDGKNDRLKIDRTAVVIEAAQMLLEKIEVPVFASIKGPFTLASFLAGPRDFLPMLLKDAARANGYIAAAMDFQRKYLSKLLAIGSNIFIGDPMSSASVISPALFKKFAFEPLRSLIGMTKSRGLLAGLHICGASRPIMNLLDELDADLLSIEDVTAPARTVKMGGVATSTVYEGDREKLAGEIQQALKEPCLIVSTSCDVLPETKQEHIKYMMESLKLHA